MSGNRWFSRLRHRRAIDFIAIALVIAGVASFFVYSSVYDTRTPPPAQPLPSNTITVTAANKSSVLHMESKKFDVPIFVPQFTPAPATELVSIAVDPHGAKRVTGVIGTNPGVATTEYVPIVSLRYQPPDGQSGVDKEMINLAEIEAGSGLPRPTGQRTVSTSEYQLFVSDVSLPSGKKAKQYTFEQATRRTIIIVGGPDEPSQASIIKMYDSLSVPV